MKPRVSLIGPELFVLDCEGEGGAGVNGEKESEPADGEVAEKGLRFMKGSILSMMVCTEWRSFRRSVVRKCLRLAEAFRSSCHVGWMDSTDRKKMLLLLLQILLLLLLLLLTRSVS